MQRMSQRIEEERKKSELGKRIKQDLAKQEEKEWLRKNQIEEQRRKKELQRNKREVIKFKQKYPELWEALELYFHKFYMHKNEIQKVITVKSGLLKLRKKEETAFLPLEELYAEIVVDSQGITIPLGSRDYGGGGDPWGGGSSSYDQESGIIRYQLRIKIEKKRYSFVLQQEHNSEKEKPYISTEKSFNTLDELLTFFAQQLMNS